MLLRPCPPLNTHRTDNFASSRPQRTHKERRRTGLVARPSATLEGEKRKTPSTKGKKLPQQSTKPPGASAMPSERKPKHYITLAWICFACRPSSHDCNFPREPLFLGLMDTLFQNAPITPLVFLEHGWCAPAPNPRSDQPVVCSPSLRRHTYVRLATTVDDSPTHCT